MKDTSRVEHGMKRESSVLFTSGMLTVEEYYEALLSLGVCMHCENLVSTDLSL